MRNSNATPGQGGFTLLEMLVVLVIAGLALSVVAFRGPRNSAALDLKGTAAEVAQSLRLARSRAVAANHTVGVTFDVGAHLMRLDGAAAHTLPAAIALAVTATQDNAAGTRLAAIRFAPDGSSSGGRVELTGNGRRVEVGVDWLTGRVSVAN